MEEFPLRVCRTGSNNVDSARTHTQALTNHWLSASLRAKTEESPTHIGGSERGHGEEKRAEQGEIFRGTLLVNAGKQACFLAYLCPARFLMFHK